MLLVAHVIIFPGVLSLSHILTRDILNVTQGSKSLTSVLPVRRNSFEHRDFVLDLKRGSQTVMDGLLVEYGDLMSFPVVSLPDIDMSFARVTIEEGKFNSAHVHPRAAEGLYLIEGVLEVYIGPENGGAGEIRNTLTDGLSTVFPKGLIHGQICLKGPCIFVAMLTSADPGNYKVAY